MEPIVLPSSGHFNYNMSGLAEWQGTLHDSAVETLKKAQVLGTTVQLSGALDSMAKVQEVEEIAWVIGGPGIEIRLRLSGLPL